MTDEDLSKLAFGVQIAGFLSAFFYGTLSGRRDSFLPTAIVFGVLLNVVAMIFIAGGGGGAFVGFFGFPLILWFLMSLGRELGRFCRWIS